MTLLTARSAFLDKVESYEGKATRMSLEPVLDELLDWSQRPRSGLTFRTDPGKQSSIRFCAASSSEIVWAVYPRMKNGAKLEILPRESDRFPEHVRAVVRGALGSLDGASPRPHSVPTLPLIRLSSPIAMTICKKQLESLA